MWAHDNTTSSLPISVVKAVPSEAEIMSECHASRAAAAVVIVIVVLISYFQSVAGELNEGQRWSADRLGKGTGLACPNMRKGQSASSSSESEDNQKPWSKDSSDASSPHVCSSAEDSSSDYDVEEETAMKRSQRFSSSFSLEEDQQLWSKNKDGGEVLPKNSGAPVTDVVQTDLVGERVQLEKRNAFTDSNEPPRSALFRPQELWLAVTRCLSLRWPPCLSISRQSNRKLAYQVEHDQSEDTQSSVSPDSTNESSSSTCTLDDRDLTLVKHEEDRSRGFKSVPPLCRMVSHSSSRLPRARQAADAMLASVILEKEMFLRIELVDSGEERDDLRYRAEWKLSERTKDLAGGVWLSKPRNNTLT